MDKPITDKIISQRADEFAEREYTYDSYERGALSKGYYWGYKDAVKDVITLIKSRLSELLGDAQPTPILRHELQDLLNQIKEKNNDTL
jgi:hypothetical protein